MTAQETAAQIIKPNKYEYEIQAGVEFIFTQSGGLPAFPSIIASCKNSTILHYTDNNSIMHKDGLVVVDIGAELNHYCADLSRTFPISGNFNKRQAEIYNIVLDTQKFIENHAKPGYWINNKEQPEKSLQHLAHKFLDQYGYSKYFIHGISHFLGMDVHDMGNYCEPLKENDVITIEPGVYIPKENIGIRIEDNYLITKNSNICLSEELPKDINDIEELMID